MARDCHNEDALVDTVFLMETTLRTFVEQGRWSHRDVIVVVVALLGSMIADVPMTADRERMLADVCHLLRTVTAEAVVDRQV